MAVYFNEPGHAERDRAFKSKAKAFVRTCAFHPRPLHYNNRGWGVWWFRLAYGGQDGFQAARVTPRWRRCPCGPETSWMFLERLGR